MRYKVREYNGLFYPMRKRYWFTRWKRYQERNRVSDYFYDAYLDISIVTYKDVTFTSLAGAKKFISDYRNGLVLEVFYRLV